MFTRIICIEDYHVDNNKCEKGNLYKSVLYNPNNINSGYIITTMENKLHREGFSITNREYRKYFISIDEYRNDKLNEILDDN